MECAGRAQRRRRVGRDPTFDHTSQSGVALRSATALHTTIGSRRREEADGPMGVVGPPPHVGGYFFGSSRNSRARVDEVERRWRSPEIRDEPLFLSGGQLHSTAPTAVTEAGNNIARKFRAGTERDLMR